MDRSKILIIEDDPVIAEFLKTGLKYEGYGVEVNNRGILGLEMAEQNFFDLIILDIMLPDTDGFDVCRRIREYGSDVSILMLTVKKNVADRVKGLDSGADDYLTKPFSFDELLARIRALLRRRGKISKTGKIRAAGITIDPETREVRKNNKIIELTPTEFDLLRLFMAHPRKAFTRDTLLNRVLGYDYDGGTNIIDVHVNHLRKKLNDKPPRLIRTIYGVGYAFHTEKE